MNRRTLHLIRGIWLLSGLLATGQAVEPVTEHVTISKRVLKDKIRGAWAAQTIGVTFGGPVEFKYNGTMIQN